MRSKQASLPPLLVSQLKPLFFPFTLLSSTSPLWPLWPLCWPACELVDFPERPLCSAMSSSTSEDDSKVGLGRSAAIQLTPQDDTPAGEKELAVEVEKLVIVKDEEIGMIPDLKHLYGGKEDKRGRFTWQVKPSQRSRLSCSDKNTSADLQALLRRAGRPSYLKTLASRAKTPTH